MRRRPDRDPGGLRRGGTASAGAAAGAGAAGAKQTSITDGFGDFEFEGLPPNTPYKVKIAATGYKSQELEVNTGASVYLGDIVLAE